MQSDHTATVSAHKYRICPVSAWAVLKIMSNINHVIKMKNIHIKRQENNIMTAGCGVSVVQLFNFSICTCKTLTLAFP